jgi:hypothetical protein
VISTRKLLSPERSFRALIILCLLVMGGAMITIARDPGGHSPFLEAMRDTRGYFFISLLLFVFFYLQYVWIAQYLKRQLNSTIGYAQALISFLLLLGGSTQVLARNGVSGPQVRSGLSSDAYLQNIEVLGEIIFVFNIVWVYLSQDSTRLSQVTTTKQNVQNVGASAKAAPPTALWGWPKSPVRLFGMAAAFFVVGGVGSLIFDLPSMKLPLPLQGQIRLVSFGHLLLAGAVPFALFALGYGWYSAGGSRKFDERGTRLHFALTFAGAFDTIRVPLSWQTFNALALPPAYVEHDLHEVSILIGVALVAFAVNLYWSYRLSGKRS